ncbi:MAG: hypothetical protein HW410_1585 [Nitrosarchaeum sp.]|nr:hypothetical protein [Nitrosarchaeum sp.]
MILSITPLSFADQRNYDLIVDGNTFDLSYDFDGELLAFGIDTESKSLLVGTTNVNESTFELSFSSEVLSAENDEFVVLVDGAETNYSVTHTDNNTKLSFVIPIATEEIEIVGTNVIPEFPLGVLAIMGIVSAATLVFSRTKLMQFR